MKMTGLMRRMERKTGRPRASRESPRTVYQAGTAQPGPALTTGPGVLCAVRTLKSLCAVSSAVPSFRRTDFLFHIPERKFGWARARRETYEQGFAI
jgi:hypothetical protein